MAIKSFEEQLVALFNAKNGSLAQALSADDVTLSVATALAGGTEGRNTKLTLTAEAASVHFTGSKEIHYIRLPAAIVGAKAVTDDQADWDTDAEVLAFLNADVIAAGATEDAFTAAELSFERTDGGSGEKIITVTVNPGHLKYLEGTVATYTITQEIVKTDLSTTDGELDGFTA